MVIISIMTIAGIGCSVSSNIDGDDIMQQINRDDYLMSLLFQLCLRISEAS